MSCVISPKSAELFAPGHHVWVGENVTARTPIFCVVLKDGEHWEVEAEWPDGTIEPVYKFKAGLEALNWVKTQSAAWVAERVGNGQPINKRHKKGALRRTSLRIEKPQPLVAGGNVCQLPTTLQRKEKKTGITRPQYRSRASFALIIR